MSDAAAGATRDRGQDLFRSRLDRIINLTHALVKLSRAIDWRFLEAQFGSVYSDGPGCPPLPTRLMAGLALLKHMYELRLWQAVTTQCSPIMSI